MIDILQDGSIGFFYDGTRAINILPVFNDIELALSQIDTSNMLTSGPYGKMAGFRTYMKLQDGDVSNGYNKKTLLPTDQDFSISYWAKLTNVTSTENVDLPLIGIVELVDISDLVSQLSVVKKTDGTYVFYAATNDDNDPTSTSATFDAEQWNHYCYIYDSDTKKIIVYLNGNMVDNFEYIYKDTVPMHLIFNFTAATANSGNNIVSFPRNGEAVVDLNFSNVRGFIKKLSDSEVLQIYSEDREKCVMSDTEEVLFVFRDSATSMPLKGGKNATVTHDTTCSFKDNCLIDGQLTVSINDLYTTLPYAYLRFSCTVPSSKKRIVDVKSFNLF